MHLYLNIILNRYDVGKVLGWGKKEVAQILIRTRKNCIGETALHVSAACASHRYLYTCLTLGHKRQSSVLVWHLTLNHVLFVCSVRLALSCVWCLSVWTFSYTHFWILLLNTDTMEHLTKLWVIDQIERYVQNVVTRYVDQSSVRECDLEGVRVSTCLELSFGPDAVLLTPSSTPFLCRDVLLRLLNAVVLSQWKEVWVKKLEQLNWACDGL